MGCVRRAMESFVAKDDPMEDVAECGDKVVDCQCNDIVEEWCKGPWTCRDGA
jgi:hypothetical protein